VAGGEEIYECDALVVGSGCAGLSAAVTAGHRGLNVLVVSYAGHAARGLPSRSSRRQARLRPLGFGVASFSRFASEGWWARQGSNL
jgi:NADPH-dependent 2,4-dienoyl-CoA reductase/sulfur reductase-like enzyme